MNPRRTAAPSPGRRIYSLRITLAGVQPPIWRQLEVESDSGIDFVAGAIRAAFGWSCGHGSEFKIKGRRYGDPSGWVRLDPEQEHARRYRDIIKRRLPRKQERIELEKLSEEIEALAVRNETDEDVIPSLEELVPRVRSKFTFLFDFGDCWDHIVRVEKIAPAEPGLDYPRCTGGAGGDPLEDCGGAWRLTQMIQLAKTDPRNRLLQQLQHLIPPNWNPDFFSLEDTDRRVGRQFCRPNA